MSTLYLEPFSGLSGDMLNALLLDLGADRKHLEEALKTISLDGYHLHVDRIAKAVFGGRTSMCIWNTVKKTMVSLATLIITTTTMNTNMNIHMLTHIRTKNTRMNIHTYMTTIIMSMNILTTVILMNIHIAIITITEKFVD